MAPIATLTLNPTVDKSTTVKQVVAERKLRCSEPTYDPGGGGLNVSRAIKALGGQAMAYWTCGGPMGEVLRNQLEAEEVPQQPIQIEQMTRENLIVFEESSTQQYRFGMPGARLSEEEAERCIERLREIDPPPEYLVLSGSLPPGVGDDFYARVARESPDNCRIILDTSGEPLRAGVDERVYLIKPNVGELGELAGKEITDDAEVEEVAKSLIAEGKVQVIVTSLGAGGVVLVTADRHEHIRAPTVPIRSKVGAGDSTVAGIVLGLAQGKRTSEAAKLGVAAGSAAVMTAGTQLCRKDDTWRLYEEMLQGRTPDE